MGLEFRSVLHKLHLGRLLPWLVVATLLLTGKGSVRAQTEETQGAPQGYREAVEEGLREFDRQNFEEARSLFLQAHTLFPNARTHRALGLVEFELRNYVDSITRLEAALASTEKALTPEQRQATERILARANGFVGRVALHVEPASALLKVDGVEVVGPRTQPFLLAIGDHLFEVSAEGYASQSRKTTIKGGERNALRLALIPLSELPQADKEPGRERAWYKSPWLWVGVGVVVAGAAAATTFALIHQNDNGPQPSGGSTGVRIAGP